MADSAMNCGLTTLRVRGLMGFRVDVKKVGDLVEGYRILAELGQGAASYIYLVQDVKTKQIWALKHVAKNTSKDQRFLDQAEAEYRVASRLDHPNIRKIPKMFKKKRQILTVRDLYLVMELVDGISLEQHPPGTFKQAVDVFHQVALGLAHMHGRGFVHADMKPHNVIVSEDGRAKVIDLGQSCAIGKVKPRIQGTPDYIAPEQVHRRAITPKTDVYNLGATMYWVLTHKHIPTALPKGDSLVSSVEDHLIEAPTPAKEINARIPDRLNDLIMQCVLIDPADRPENMMAVSDRLDLILGILNAESERAGSDSVA